MTPNTIASRYATNGYPVYKDFCSFFVSSVVGIRHFDQNKCHIRFSESATISDEAFTVFTLENNWARWSSMAIADQWKDSDVPSKWATSHDKRRTSKSDEAIDSSDDEAPPQARRYRGWSAQGIARYNQLFKEIKMEREKDTYAAFEKYCMDGFQKEAEDQGLNKHKRKRTKEPTPLPQAMHELWVLPVDNNPKEDDSGAATHRLPTGLQGLA